MSLAQLPLRAQKPCTHKIESVAFAYGGSLLAMAAFCPEPDSDEPAVFLWDPDAGSGAGAVLGHIESGRAETAASLAWSHDNRYLHFIADSSRYASYEAADSRATTFHACAFAKRLWVTANYLAISGHQPLVVRQSDRGIVWQGAESAIDGAATLFSPKTLIVVDASETYAFVASPGQDMLQQVTLATGETVATTLPNHRSPDQFLIGPRNRYLAVMGIPNGGMLYDLQTGTNCLPSHFSGDTAPEYAAFHPAGDLIATSTGDALMVFDLASGQEVVMQRVAERGRTTAMSFSSDGRWLALATSAGELYLLNMNTILR